MTTSVAAFSCDDGGPQPVIRASPPHNTPKMIGGGAFS
jgi:hypothetical protein